LLNFYFINANALNFNLLKYGYGALHLSSRGKFHSTNITVLCTLVPRANLSLPNIAALCTFLSNTLRQSRKTFVEGQVNTTTKGAAHRNI
jgi:hypothetical protein